MIKDLNTAVRPKRRLDDEDFRLLQICLQLGLEAISIELAEEGDWNKRKILKAEQTRMLNMSLNLQAHVKRLDENQHFYVTLSITHLITN